jgi:DNA-binding NtrC family response regulator
MSQTALYKKTPAFRCLILEDDLNLAELNAAAVNAAGGDPVIAASVEQAGVLVALHEFDMFVLDQQLPDGKGSDFFSYLREQGTTAPCLMLTGMPEVQTAVELTRHGLFDYLTKPLDMRQLIECLQRAHAHCAAAQSSLHEFGLVDFSRSMRAVRRLVYQAAANPLTTVLLTGETGVGKDLFARAIHQLTFQATEPRPQMVSLNCSTLPADMFESELFGASKGAYTGAHQNRAGLAEAAQGGTLFLDEIGEVPLLLQAKLLQFLETREYRRLGQTGTQRFDGRIIAATNKSLDTEVQAGTFRADLLYRLDVFNIRIPPLRDRKEDITPLVEFILDTLCRKYERARPVPRPEDLAALQDYDFPGNVRELRNIVERSLLQTSLQAPWLEMDCARFRLVRPAATPAALAPAVFATTTAPPPAPAPVPTPTPTPTERQLTPMEQQEYNLIRSTLIGEKGFIRRSATKLGMSHQALLRRLEKWPELRTT